MRRLLVARRHGDDGSQRGHRAVLQPPPRRLVGVVVAEGEHADLLAVAQVAHDEVRVALGLHARLVEAVAPRGVLERVVADGGPEARRGRPRGVLAGERAPGDLAVGQRVAPVLDAQAPARRARAAPRRCRRRRARPGPSCASRRPRAPRRPRGRGRRRLASSMRGATPVPSTTRSAGSASPPSSRTRQCGSMRSTSAPRRTSTPASHSSVVMSSPGALAQALAPAGAPRARRGRPRGRGAPATPPPRRR